MSETESPISLALYQPDIAQNTGTLMRLSACLGVPIHVIGPMGFRMDDAALKRAGMDYLELANLTRHREHAAFEIWRRDTSRRLLLLTTKADGSYLDFTYQPGDVLMVGSESSGVPEDVHAGADHRIRIPMLANRRSLNVALAAAMVLGEALRQTSGFPT